MSQPSDNSQLRRFASPLITGHDNVLAGTAMIDGFFDHLGRINPGTQRQIVEVPQGETAVLAQKAVPFRQGPAVTPPARPPSKRPSTFFADTHGTVGVNIRANTHRDLPEAFVLALPLVGVVNYRYRGQPWQVEPMAGAVFDQTLLEGARWAPDFHFVECSLAQQDLVRLAHEEMPGMGPQRLTLRAALSPVAAQRMLFMAVQAAEALAQSEARGNTMLFQRWYDLMGLSLLHDQAVAEPGARRAAASQASPASLRRATEFIHAHAARAVGLADVAQAACLSVSGLLRQFKAHLGTTPFAYLQGVRLDRAREALITDPPCRVQDVALRWGFQNASKFSQAYKRRFGELPSQTRRTER